MRPIEPPRRGVAFALGSSLRQLRTLALGLVGLVAGLPSAHAVPSFARQTGQECAACHVGAYGPQLTPYGVKFKIGGYTDSDGKGGKVPISAMIVASFNQTAKNLPEKPEHGSVNRNLAMDEASLFLAGRLSEKIGAFIAAGSWPTSSEALVRSRDCLQPWQLHRRQRSDRLRQEADAFRQPIEVIRHCHR